MEDEPEKKEFLGGIFDSIKDAIDNAVESVRKTWNRLLGKEEVEEGGEEGEGGLSNILEDVINWHNNLWDNLLGRKEGEEEGEKGKGGFDIGKIIRDVRNKIREILGMEPISEE